MDFELGEILSLSGTIITVGIAIITFMIGRLTAKHAEGKEDGIIASELGYVKSQLDNLTKMQRDQADKSDLRHLEIIDRVSKLEAWVGRVESSDKSVHHRVDRIEKEMAK